MFDNYKKPLSYLLTIVLTAAITLSITSVQHPAGKLDELESLIGQRFIGEYDPVKAEDGAAAGMVAALGDRWSYYISAKDYAAYEERMNNAYVGIGVTITPAEDESGVRILSVTAGGPAEEAGLQVDDVIVGVNGESIQGMDTNDVRDRVRGEEGTSVSLTILRKGEPFAVSVMRRAIQTPVAVGKMLADSVGLVTIANFDSRCASESIAAIEELLSQGAKMLIFDVRYNPGGYASELVELLDYLLPEGELFRTVDYTGREHVDNSDSRCLDIPMAVLVNGESYSAAEFFAAALREYDAAFVAGEQTCGKGYFQQTFRLSDGSAVGLSVGKYFTPKGENLANVGITPDVIVPVDEDTAYLIYAGALDPEEDPQLQAALNQLLRNNKIN